MFTKKLNAVAGQYGGVVVRTVAPPRFSPANRCPQSDYSFALVEMKRSNAENYMKSLNLVHQ